MAREKLLRPDEMELLNRCVSCGFDNSYWGCYISAGMVFCERPLTNLNWSNDAQK